MKKGWTEVALGEVLHAAERFEAPLPGVKYRQLGVRLWGEGAYERDRIDGGNTQYSTFNRCCSGDLVVNKIWARNGSVSVISDVLEGCYVSSEFPLFVAGICVNPEWLKVITKAPWFWKACDKKAQGTSGKNRIKPSKFLEIIIPLPPLSEQQRIVAHLDAVEKRLQRVQKLRQEQELEILAALRSAFHKIESTAEWVEMEEVAPLVRRPIEIEPDGRYPALAVRSFGRGVFHKPTLNGSELTWQKLFRVCKGDIVISNIKAWEGALAVADESDHGRVGSHRYLTCVADSERVLPEIIGFYLLTHGGLEQVNRASPGSADRNRTLAVKRLNKIKIPVPPMKLQHEFLKLLSLRNKIKAEADKSIQRRVALLPSLLDRVFGENP